MSTNYQNIYYIKCITNFSIQYNMFRAIPSLNKHIRNRQEKRNRNLHLQHLSQLKNNITHSQQTIFQPILNHKKKQVLLGQKIHKIQRQNLMLLDKITGIMANTKRQASSTLTNYRINTPRSLNQVKRKKKMEQIQLQNIKLLKRLQEKKSEYPVQKMKKQWQKMRSVVKNISLYPLVNLQNTNKQKLLVSNQDKQQLKPIYLSKYKKIDGYDLFIIVKLDYRSLKIKAYRTQKDQFQKLIELDRQQALFFIKHECHGEIQKIFDRLKFDGKRIQLISEYEKLQRQLKQIKKQQEKQTIMKQTIKQQQQFIDTNDQVEIKLQKQKIITIQDFNKDQIVGKNIQMDKNIEMDKNMVIG